jgi:hypothetical protein
MKTPKGLIYRDTYIDKIKPFIGKPVIKVLTEHRRVGKSYLFYRTEELFRQAVMKFFENIADCKQELETLLTLNCRLVNSHSISF